MVDVAINLQGRQESSRPLEEYLSVADRKDIYRLRDIRADLWDIVENSGIAPICPSIWEMASLS